MPEQHDRQAMHLFRLLMIPLLALAPVVCLAAEPVSENLPLPSDPREALRQSGVNSFDKGALSNIVIRGYQRENLMVTFDGAPYFGATPFRSDAPPFIVNNSDISKIVVTKGPYNLAYPGGAGGSIEVSSPENPKRFSARSSFSYGSYDAVNGTAYVAVGNQLADFGAGYRGRSSGVPEAGGGVPLVRTRYPNANNNYRVGAEELAMYRLDSFWLKGGISPTTDNRFELSYAFVQGSDIKFPTQNIDVLDEQVHRLNGRLTLRNLTPMLKEVSLQGWWSQARTLLDDSLRETSDTANTALPYRAFLNRGYATSNRFDVTTTGGRLTSQLALGPGILTKGIDFYQRDWNGSYAALLKPGAAAWQYYDNQPLLPDTVTRNLGMFWTYATPLSDTVRAVLSARGDFSRVDANGLTPDRIQTLYQPYYPGQGIPTGRDFADWNANAQLFWKVVPQLELFVKGGRAVRIPDASELYMGQVRQGSNIVSNPFLQQTAVHQIDTGASWSAGGHRAELIFFYGKATDFILPVKRDPDGSGPIVQARSTTNLNAIIWGVECEGTVQLPADLKLSAMLSYSEGENQNSNRPLAEIPPLRGRLGIKYDNRYVFAGINQTLVARQNRFDTTLNETSMPGYAVTDLQAGGRYKGITLTVSLNNLFDARYVMPLYYQRDPLSPTARIPENGRNVTMTASYRF